MTEPAFSWYSPSTRGFYREHIHGPRELEVVDPAWRPKKGRGQDQAAPLVRTPNPATRIPADAVPVTAQEHRTLFAGQAKGREIAAGPDGRPTLVDPKGPEPAWDVLRRHAYGPVADQLEMIYRDLKAAGIEGEFTRHVEAVKAAHPKPAS